MNMKTMSIITGTPTTMAVWTLSYTLKNIEILEKEKS